MKFTAFESRHKNWQNPYPVTGNVYIVRKYKTDPERYAGSLVVMQEDAAVFLGISTSITREAFTRVYEFEEFYGTIEVTK